MGIGKQEKIKRSFHGFLLISWLPYFEEAV
jgi:hypothetical protein